MTTLDFTDKSGYLWRKEMREKGKRGNVKRETKGYSCKIVWDYWGNQIYDMTR